MKNISGTANPRWLIPSILPAPRSAETLHVQCSLLTCFSPLFSSTSKPAPYIPALRPLPSSLRHHCLGRERIRKWTPSTARIALDSKGAPINLDKKDLDRIRDVLAQAYAESTAGTYGTGLLAFHVFCDQKGIHEEQRAPASQILLAGFVTALVGAYAGKTIANYIHGVRAWHIIHGVDWKINKAEMDGLLKAAEFLTPTQARRPKRKPFTVQYIEAIKPHIDTSLPLGAAVFACLTTTFWSAARLGETTIPRLNAFDPTIHVQASAPKEVSDRKGNIQTEFFIPRTKTNVHGECIYWARQEGDVDPKAALENHFLVNNPPPHGALFAYAWPDSKGNPSHRPLTKPAFMKVIHAAAKTAGLEMLKGHGIRIGATLEYLLRGVRFDVVKVIGRWHSDAFLDYLRKHAKILAPYMQATPDLADEFTCYTTLPAPS